MLLSVLWENRQSNAFILTVTFNGLMILHHETSEEMFESSYLSSTVARSKLI